MLKIDIEKRYRVMVPDFQFVQLVVAGVGGTGSAVAIDLARLAYHCQENGLPVMMQLVDGDKVEPKNVGRQQFSMYEVGENKATSMARRLNLWLGLDITGTPKMLTEKTKLIFNDGRMKPLRIIVGAVDNHKARRAIAKHAQKSGAWWVDAGNGEFKGQVLLGNYPQGGIEVAEDLALMNGLPAPDKQMPELLEEEDKPTLEFEDCALRILRDEQSININRLMATYAAQVVYDLIIKRELDYMAIHTSFRPPSTTAVPVTRRTLERYGEVKEVPAKYDPKDMDPEEFDDEEDFEQWLLDMEMEGEEELP
ncbi:MAG: PRTRC system ThiF family protein [Anaerolineae bacterium]|nr:PRTRC system ThiF family protein [Anaerolineae bacterium]